MRLLKFFIAAFIFTLYAALVNAQNGCTELGQKPTTAFPVCGVDTFEQATVPACVNDNLEVPGCAGTAIYQDLNPYWYSFTCYTAGTLGFVIIPNEATDDYDWQLFDITGHNPEDVYTDASLFVVGNWAGTYASTGASNVGNNTIECASDPLAVPPVNTFSIMPNLEVGHNYLLMVSHYTSTNQSGYKLIFRGGTANITDPTTPGFSNATATCDGSILRIKLNKKMKCSSLRADGSDFEIQGQTVKVIAAAGIGCSSGFDVDSVVLTLNGGLAAGTYKLAAKIGGDSNTMLDNCNNSIPVGATIDFTVYPQQPTPLDSIAPVACAPNAVQLVFRKNMRCSSIAANGSDFYITGFYPVTVVGAAGVCTDGLSSVINVTFAAPLVKEGTFTLHLQRGSDGNSIIDECGEEIIVPASINFSVKDTVSADFTYILTENCRNDVIDLFNNGGASITNWQWSIDDSIASVLQNPSFIFTTYGNKNIKLSVTNGFCNDTAAQVIHFPHDTLIAAINGPAVHCPNDVSIFTDTSRGNIIEWNWQFGNGRTSNLENPPGQTYYTTEKEKIFPVSLTVKNTKGCFDTVIHYIKVASNCHINVPTGFTPNGDGRNDYLYPLNAYKATNLFFVIYNRIGQKIYETRDWTKKWDGTFNGQAQATGVYVWMLQYRNEFGKDIFLKGTSVLLR